MKKRILAALIAFSVLTVLLIGCHKSMDEEVLVVPYPLHPVMNCSYSPYYGDTLVCLPNGNGADYIVSPVNSPGAGRYYSWPVGMIIDHYTGAINVTQSEPGMRYMVGFVKQGSTDTCLTPLIVTGMSYMDSVHVLSDSQNTSSPYFNADPNLFSACASGNCQIDINGQVTNKNIAINKTTGVIDLQKTLDQGAFGLNPVNGDYIEVTLTYKINDGCTKGVQKMKLKFMYFNSKAQIDVALINEVLSKQASIRGGNTNTSYKPRPPLIIITRYN